MITILTDTRKLTAIDAEAYAVMLEHEFSPDDLNELCTLYEPLFDIIKARSFTALKQTLVITGVRNGKPVTIILLGLGTLRNKSANVEVYRRTVGRLVRIIEQYHIRTIACTLPFAEKLGISDQRLAQETTTIMLKARYCFDQFITQKKEHAQSITCTFAIHPQQQADIEVGIQQGIVIGQAINKARYWCDMPPSQLTPIQFAQQAEKTAEQYGLTCTILNEQEMHDLHMGGIVAVSRGSCEPARLVCLEYNVAQEAPTIALVGKGITFDSGGLSLKPAKAMETMKDDMSGAAIVLSTMQVIGQLKPRVNVVAVAALAENMPGCGAIKPGDIVTFYNGKTAEIKNTDAEGRLVLADALSYAAAQYKPVMMLDLATLTGACMAALGPFYAGLFSKDDELVAKLLTASSHSGDRLWRLPFDEDYRAAIRSDIADMSNIGTAAYMSGATTAALFLHNFVGDTPWAHIDIAGVAFGVPDMSYLRPGATGFGIRLLTDLLMHWHVD